VKKSTGIKILTKLRMKVQSIFACLAAARLKAMPT